jgi:hypothetical protein
MINIKLSDILDVGSQYTKNFPLALTVGSLFVFEIFSIIPLNYQNVNILNLPLDLLTYLNGLLYGSSSSSLEAVNLTQNPHGADTVFFNFSQLEALGQGLYTYGAVIFIVCSIILLLAMLAPISIVHSKSTNNHQSPRPTSVGYARVISALGVPKGRWAVNPSPGSNSFGRPSSFKVNLQYNLSNRASYHTSSSSENKDLTLDQTSNLKLNPWTVTGITDAEGCFGFTIHRRKDPRPTSVGYARVLSALGVPKGRWAEVLKLDPEFLSTCMQRNIHCLFN